MESLGPQAQEDHQALMEPLDLLALLVPPDPEGPKVRKANVVRPVKWVSQDLPDPLVNPWAMMQPHSPPSWDRALQRQVLVFKCIFPQ
jgi:hypothetical protein